MLKIHNKQTEIESNNKEKERTLVPVGRIDINKINEEEIVEIANKNIAALIDIGYEIDQHKKYLDKKFSFIKDICVKQLKENGLKLLEGESKGKIVASKKTTRNIDIKKYISLLKKLEKSKLLFETVSVKISEAEKYIPKDELEKISDITTDDYGMISFKSK